MPKNSSSFTNLKKYLLKFVARNNYAIHLIRVGLFLLVLGCLEVFFSFSDLVLLGFVLMFFEFFR